MHRQLPSQTGQRVGNPITDAANRLGASFGVNTTNPVNFLAEGAPLQVPDGRSQNPFFQGQKISPYGDGVQPIMTPASVATTYDRRLERGLQSSPVEKGVVDAGHRGGYPIGDKRSPIYRITESMQQGDRRPQGTNTGFQVAGGTGRNQSPPVSTDLQSQPTT